MLGSYDCISYHINVHTDYAVPDPEWAPPEYSSTFLLPHALYFDGTGTHQPRAKLSIIELVLCNLAAMLAGVAAGFDIRVANSTVLHPRLVAER